MDPAERRGPEERLAMAAIGLLCLQMARETVDFCIGSSMRGGVPYDAAAPVLLTLYGIALAGLWERSNLARWFSVFLFGGIGLLHTAVTWSMMTESFHQGSIARNLRPRSWGSFDLLWVGGNNGLMLAVAVLLIVDRIRWRLRKDRAERIRDTT